MPEGEALDFASDRFLEFEERGARAASDAVFVLVAGGLGERLGYSGIKASLLCKRGLCLRACGY